VAVLVELKALVKDDEGKTLYEVKEALLMGERKKRSLRCRR